MFQRISLTTNVLLSRSMASSLRCSKKYRLVENYRNNWPDISRISDAPSEPFLPKKTIPDSALRFTLKATFDAGSAIFYNHLKQNPAEFKVILHVYTDDLKLSPVELQIFKRMVGPRLNPNMRELRLISSKFPNRVENKRYLTVLLEDLVSTAKKLASKHVGDTDFIQGLPHHLLGSDIGGKVEAELENKLASEHVDDADFTLRLRRRIFEAK